MSQILRINCFLHDAIERQMTEVKGVGRRRTQLLDYLRNRRKYWKLKEELKIEKKNIYIYIHDISQIHRGRQYSLTLQQCNGLVCVFRISYNGVPLRISDCLFHAGLHTNLLMISYQPHGLPSSHILKVIASGNVRVSRFPFQSLHHSRLLFPLGRNTDLRNLKICFKSLKNNHENMLQILKE